MVMTASTMLPLGTAAPEFSLPNTVDGSTVSPSDFAGDKGLLVIFLCNHCPFVVHLRSALASFAAEYQEQGLGIVGISSNDVTTHPDDGPEKMGGWNRSGVYSCDATHRSLRLVESQL